MLAQLETPQAALAKLREIPRHGFLTDSSIFYSGGKPAGM
jgi:hypothetical protein